jgi:pimeloyl-CoA synthetase
MSTSPQRVETEETKCDEEKKESKKLNQILRQEGTQEDFLEGPTIDSI